MGVFVHDCVLPSGIPISNVYMSFSGSLVYVEPKNNDGMYFVRAFCKVFKDQTKSLDPDITFQVVTAVTDINLGAYNCLYGKLKEMFSNSEDVI
jgi:hypothetical protein